ncbi:uncharacterized protein [Ptychodera flava]|uniref:uncharacterized protein n=1 Tax=Ptychodera flava TaxID=63121 RepID=UPI00396AA6A7
MKSASEEWKRSCKNILQQNDTDMDTILHLAKQPETVAVKLDEIFENYERRVLAGQKVTKKNLMAKPDIPVYLFSNLVHLNEDSICEYLQEVLDGDNSLQKMNSEAKEVRKMRVVQESFVKELGMPWNVLEEKLPSYADREYLCRFKDLKFSRGTPLELKQECKKIRDMLDSGEVPLESTALNIFTAENNTRGCVVDVNITSLTLETIRDTCPEFNGAELSLISIPEDWSEDCFTEQVNKVKSLNLDCNIPYFNIVALCDVESISSVKKILGQTCCRVEEGYYFLQFNKSSSKTLWKSVKGLVVGYWSETGAVNAVQVNFGNDPHHNLWIVEDVEQMSDFLSKIITMFCAEGRWILDATRKQGSVFTTALQLGRPCVCLEAEADQLECIYSSATQKLSWSGASEMEELSVPAQD